MILLILSISMLLLLFVKQRPNENQDLVDVTTLNQYDYIIEDPEHINDSDDDNCIEQPPPSASTTTKKSSSSSSKSETKSNQVATINEDLLRQCFESKMTAIPPTAQINPFCNPYDDNIYYTSENGLTEY